MKIGDFWKLVLYSFIFFSWHKQFLSSKPLSNTKLSDKTAHIKLYSCDFSSGLELLSVLTFLIEVHYSFWELENYHPRKILKTCTYTVTWNFVYCYRDFTICKLGKCEAYYSIMSICIFLKACWNEKSPGQEPGNLSSPWLSKSILLKLLAN